MIANWGVTSKNGSAHLLSRYIKELLQTCAAIYAILGLASNNIWGGNYCHTFWSRNFLQISHPFTPANIVSAAQVASPRSGGCWLSVVSRGTVNSRDERNLLDATAEAKTLQQKQEEKLFGWADLFFEKGRHNGPRATECEHNLTHPNIPQRSCFSRAST